jgi:hypothetical protein
MKALFDDAPPHAPFYAPHRGRGAVRRVKSGR